MSKKNSSVNLKKTFNDFEDLSNIFQNFRRKLDNLKKNRYLVAVSGGPDSLALVALTKAYALLKKTKFYYILVDHKIRKNSYQEANKVKKMLKKYQINLTILTNKKKNYKKYSGRSSRYKIRNFIRLL